MKRCDAMVDVGRRKFLTGAGIAAGAAAANFAVTEAKAAPVCTENPKPYCLGRESPNISAQ